MTLPDTAGMQWFATLGVGGAIAGFMFILYRQDVAKYTQMWQEESKLNRETLGTVLGVVRDNTAALVKVITTIDSLHRRIDYANSNEQFPQRDVRDNG